MAVELVSQLTSFLTPQIVAVIIGALLVADFVDMFSDRAKSLDLLIRTLITVGVGYLVITAGLAAF